MNVQELIEELKALPPTALVLVAIEMNEDWSEGTGGEWCPFDVPREETILSVGYDRGVVYVHLDEPEPSKAYPKTAPAPATP